MGQYIFRTARCPAPTRLGRVRTPHFLDRRIRVSRIGGGISRHYHRRSSEYPLRLSGRKTTWSPFSVLLLFSRWRLDPGEARVVNGSHWAVCTIHCACNSPPTSEKLSDWPETIRKGRRPSAKRQNWAPDNREKTVDIFHAGDRDARSVRRTHVKALRHTSDKRLQVSPTSETGSRRDLVKTRFSRDQVKTRFISNYTPLRDPS